MKLPKDLSLGRARCAISICRKFYFQLQASHAFVLKNANVWLLFIEYVCLGEPEPNCDFISMSKKWSHACFQPHLFVLVKNLWYFPCLVFGTVWRPLSWNQQQQHTKKLLFVEKLFSISSRSNISWSACKMYMEFSFHHPGQMTHHFFLFLSFFFKNFFLSFFLHFGYIPHIRNFSGIFSTISSLVKQSRV